MKNKSLLKKKNILIASTLLLLTLVGVLAFLLPESTPPSQLEGNVRFVSPNKTRNLRFVPSSTPPKVNPKQFTRSSSSPVNSRKTTLRPVFTTNTTLPSYRITNQVQLNPAATAPGSKNDAPAVTAVCGDGKVTVPETCDDGNKMTETCAYGDMNCIVCNASCKEIDGETSYCGDNKVDELNGEMCEGGNNCDDQCQLIEAENQVPEEEEVFEFDEIQMDFEDYFDQVLDYVIQKETNEYEVPNGQIDLSAYNLGNVGHLEAFGAALEFFLNQDYLEAADIFAKLDYEVIRLVDGNQSHFVIKETQFDGGDFAKGWGVLFIKEGVNDDVFLSVPHPKFDTNSPTYGLEAYQLMGEALYLSGSHRRANIAPSGIQPNYKISDQAHNDHILTVIGDVFSGGGFTDTFIEFHGHNTSKWSVLEDGGYNAVISKGSASSTSTLQLGVINRLNQNGFANPGGCGIHFNNVLCGTQNRLKAAIGGDEFLHVEIGSFYRDNANLQSGAQVVAQSILEAL